MLANLEQHGRCPARRQPQGGPCQGPSIHSLLGQGCTPYHPCPPRSRGWPGCITWGKDEEGLAQGGNNGSPHLFQLRGVALSFPGGCS